MGKLLTIVFAALLVTSCSPFASGGIAGQATELLGPTPENLSPRQVRRYRKARRKVERALELWPDLLQSDTIRLVDTVITPADTVVVRDVLRLPGDTVVVETPGGIRTVIIRESTGGPCDTAFVPVRVETSAPADTVFVTRDVMVPGWGELPGCGVAPFWRTLALVGWGLLVMVALVRRIFG